MLKKEDERSIHPRVEKGRTIYDKVNTCKPSRRDTRTMRRVNKRLDARTREMQISINCASPKNKGSFTMPGSRNPNRCR